jgi:hypothetical protein
LADLADDPVTLAEAEPIALKWLADPASVDGNIGPLALKLASRRAGPGRFDALVHAVKTAKRPQDRIAALEAIGGFDDPALVERALDWALLTDDVRLQDVRYVLDPVLTRRPSRPIAYVWVKTHWQEATKKLTGPLGGRLFQAAGVACSQEEVKDARDFFTPRAPLVEGATRSLAERLEGAMLCAELRKSIAPAVARFFSK